MSQTETHIGKLQIKHKDFSIEAFRQFLSENEGLYVDDLEERLEDGDSVILVTQGDWRGVNLYAYHNNTLYKFLEHKKLDDEDIDITTPNGDGTIDFAYQFYNGGTCFTEMLEDGLSKIKNK